MKCVTLKEKISGCLSPTIGLFSPHNVSKKKHHSTWQSHNSSQVNPRWKGCRPHRRPGIKVIMMDPFHKRWILSQLFRGQMLLWKITSFSYFWLTMFKLLRKIKLERMLSFNCVIGASFKPLKSWGVWIDVLMLAWILCREALDCCGRGVRISVSKHKCQNMITEWSTLVKKSHPILSWRCIQNHCWTLCGESKQLRVPSFELII